MKLLTIFLKLNQCYHTTSYKKDRYIIYYNDTHGNKGLEPFTIAHELGHYFLGHMKYGRVFRGGLGNKLYDDLEKEVNSFARNLLAPLPMLDTAANHDLYIEKIESVKDLFAVSHDAAIARLELVHLDRKKFIKYK